MINLSEYITQENICFLPNAPYERVLTELMRHCLRDREASVFEAAVKDILAKNHSRGPLDINLGKGFALAHSRLRNLDRIHLGLGLLPENRKLLKGEPVHTVLGLAIPEKQSRMYLSLLARMSRMLDREHAGDVFQEAGRLGASRVSPDERQAREMIVRFVRDFEND